MLVALVALAACTSTPSAPSSPSLHAPATTSSPVDPRLAAVQNALDAYRNMWQAYVSASNAGDPQSPNLPKYASDSALQTLVRGLTTNKSKGLTSKGAPRIAPVQIGFSPAGAPTHVMVADCLDDSSWLLYKANGDLADNTPGGRHKVTAQVDKINADWKVSAFAELGVGTC